MDVALLENNVVTQVWKNETLSNVSHPGQLIEVPEAIVGMVWDGTSLSPPLKPLADIKAEANDIVNSWRVATEEGGFSYAGKVFDSDRLSAQRIQGAMQTAQIVEASNPGTYSQVWKAKDNTYVTLDYNGDPSITGLFMALSQHIADTFSASENYKAQIAAATTADEVQAVLDSLP